MKNKRGPKFKADCDKTKTVSMTINTVLLKKSQEHIKKKYKSFSQGCSKLLENELKNPKL